MHQKPSGTGEQPLNIWGCFIMKLYSEKLKDPRWQKKRLKILELDNWTCTECSCKTDTLHVHHKDYKGKDPWDTPDAYLCTLCSKCHDLEEILKKNEILYDFAKSLNVTCIHIWKGLAALSYIEKNNTAEFEVISKIFNKVCWVDNTKSFFTFLSRPNG